MLGHNRAQTVQQAKQTVNSALPVVTTALALVGATLAAMEGAKLDSQESAAQRQAKARALAMQARGRLTVGRYLLTLAQRVALTLLGVALVTALALVAVNAGPTGVAVELTALILLALYLTEKVARRSLRK